jgi:hypothetical protein
MNQAYELLEIGFYLKKVGQDNAVKVNMTVNP